MVKTTESSTDNSKEDSLEDNKMDGQGAPNVSNENSTKEDGGHMDNPDYHANILNQYRMGHPYSKVNMENTGSLDDDYNYDYEDGYIVNAQDYPCTENHYITCPMGKTCREGKLCNGTITKDCPINQTCIINKDTQPECVPKSTPEPILVPCPEEEKTKLICDYGDNCFLDKDRKNVCVLTP
ncbi:unnamed protein product [Lepeophtheirus salmonis]|uniref:(salmon louse) hypothetical protein n=1 Tax=Lepeophtheirus salmonis TaxID=72036 RepID=A0A7R8CAJ9_LEPSM|nr:unnamed protein product [Lepeophtheirus salmonis]CAF2751920.1 unnamed protein product [Lepeophtheirus salmonis]